MTDRTSLITLGNILAAILAALLIPLAPAQRNSSAEVTAEAAAAGQKEQQASIRINQLAGNIHSLTDAGNYVNAVAKEFSGELPPAWATAAIRERIAQAEYRATTSPVGLIPEQRVADAWNRYVNEIGAPGSTLVTVAVVHNLRDGDYTAARLMWARGLKEIWTVPSLYALDSDGKVASGCRPVEALKVLWELANQPENVSRARERARRGVLASDLLRQQQQYHHSDRTRGEVRAYSRPEDPTEAAERHYINEHGIADFSLLVYEMIGNLLPQR